MGVFTTASNTWAVGSKITAALLNGQLRDLINGFGAWTSYTPTWTASTTNPTIGNGTITGAYLQVNKLVMCYGKITVGTTTTAGTGAYTISVPVNASAAITGTNIPGNGTIWFRDASVPGDYMAIPVFAVNNAFQLRQVGVNTNVLIGAAAPAAPASTDFYSWFITYEAA